MKIHTPGVNGEIGGYPYTIDGRDKANGHIDETVFTLEAMRKANRASIYLDGIENVENGILTYTDELIEKVKIEFGCNLSKQVSVYSNDMVSFLIDKIINTSILRNNV